MSVSLLKGTGSVSATTEFQLLNPAAMQGGSFWYDFFLKGESSDADAVWQIEGGAGYVDMAGAAGVAGQDDTEWLKRAEIDDASTGAVQIAVTAGDVSYWYALSGGNSFFPSIRSAAGVTSDPVEFFVCPNRVYTLTSDGTQQWNIWDGSAWVPMANGTDNNISINAPATRRIQLVPTGAVNFSITSYSVAE